MFITMCTAKIHGATVTQADLNYIGSITIDKTLLEASGIKPRQYVNITNLSNAAFWRTYVMEGEKDSGVICLNGPPARLFQPGDKVMILAEAWIKPEELWCTPSIIVLVDNQNRVTGVKKEVEYP